MYETADGRHMAVGALEPQFYAEFVRLLDAGPDLPDRIDLTRWPELRERFAARFRTRTMAEWSAVFDGTDACVAPVVSFTEAPRAPAARGPQHVRHRRRGRAAGPGPRFSRTPAEVGAAPGRCPGRTPARRWPTGASTTSTTCSTRKVVIQR